jgi:pilus assembly protein CpaD
MRTFEMTRVHLPIMRPRRGRWAATALLLLGLAACKHNPETTGIVDTSPTDHRQRHPIAIKEGDRTVDLFIGRARGGLSPSQRADVAGFAYAWKREATGGIIIDVPTGTEHACRP